MRSLFIALTFLAWLSGCATTAPLSYELVTCLDVPPMGKERCVIESFGETTEAPDRAPPVELEYSRETWVVVAEHLASCQGDVRTLATQLDAASSRAHRRGEAHTLSCLGERRRVLDQLDASLSAMQPAVVARDAEPTTTVAAINALCGVVAGLAEAGGSCGLPEPAQAGSPPSVASATKATRPGH